MKYFFDKQILDYYKLDYKPYYKVDIFNKILNDDNTWSNLNGRIILNNNLLNILNNKYPKNSKLTYKRLFNTPGYWNNQIKNGFNVSAIHTIINSLICESSNEYNLDMGMKVKNLEI